MSDEFATVLKSWSVEEAHLARIRLADEGIESHLVDDQTVAMDWGLANAIHGVSVVVKQSDAVDARRLLEEQPSGESFAFPKSTDDQADEIADDDPSRDGLENLDEDNRETGTLRSMRSIARPVILLFFIPGILGILLIFAHILMGLLNRFTGRSY